MSSNLEKEIEANIKKELSLLLSESRSLNACLQLLPSPRVKRAMNTLRQVQPLLVDLGKTPKGKQKTLFDATMYLFGIETSTNLIADILIIMLAAQGQFLHIEPDDKYRFIRHATTIEDLESPTITLAMKLSFLKKSGFTCFQKYIDKNLRNKIAHFDFEIDANGDFFLFQLKKGIIEKKKVDVMKKLDTLLLFNSITMHQIKLAIYKTKKQAG